MSKSAGIIPGNDMGTGFGGRPDYDTYRRWYLTAGDQETADHYLACMLNLVRPISADIARDLQRLSYDLPIHGATAPAPTAPACGIVRRPWRAIMRAINAWCDPRGDAL